MAIFKDDERPLDSGCTCFTCQHHSRAYIRHLFASGELLAKRLCTIHNLHYIFTLMASIREAIQQEDLHTLARKWALESVLPKI